MMRNLVGRRPSASARARFSFRSIVTAVCCLLAVCGNVHAQDPETEWGKVSDEQASMMSFPDDPDASAIVLFDIGEVSFDDQFFPIETRHRRVKILNDAGYRYGTFSIPTFTELGEEVVGLDAHTLVPVDAGGYREVKLPRAAVFSERVTNGVETRRFTLPALEPGAIVEVRYTRRSGSISSVMTLAPWMFQEAEPTIWSEYVFKRPDELVYSFAIRATAPFYAVDSRPMKYGRGEEHRWVARNVPALREEPFMKAASDYRASVRAQIAGFSIRGENTREFLQSWKQLARTLLDTKPFRYTKPEGEVKEKVAEVSTGIDDELERMERIYDWVRTTIEWNEVNEWFATDRPSEVLKRKTGTSADVALLLTTMLNAAKIEAWPILLSTRSHGTITEQYPLLQQFDYMITLARVDGEDYFLDATSPNRAYNVLPVRALSGRGLVVDKDPGFVDIEAPSEYRRLISYRAMLSPEGVFEGDLAASDRGYSALEKRSFLAAHADEEMVAALIFPGVPVAMEDVRIQGREATTDDLVTRARVSITDRTQSAGDYLYVTTSLGGNLGENPLKKPTRSYPVDFGYARNESWFMELRIPDGYDVESLPDDRHFILPFDGGKFVRSTTIAGDVVRINQVFELSRTIYMPSEYEPLQKLYDYILAAQDDQLVLKRGGEEADAGG